MVSIRLIKLSTISLTLSILSGCSLIPFFGSSSSSDSGNSYYPNNTQNECATNRASCMYEGSYEKGERNFAELEARRLNQASLRRLRQNAVR